MNNIPTCGEILPNATLPENSNALKARKNISSHVMKAKKEGFFTKVKKIFVKLRDYLMAKLFRKKKTRTCVKFLSHLNSMKPIPDTLPMTDTEVEPGISTAESTPLFRRMSIEGKKERMKQMVFISPVGKDEDED